MADAVIFVSDASQEFTGPEIEFLQTARRMCPNVVCVLTKIDFYPAWRKIRDLNVEHLKRAGSVRAAVRVVVAAGPRPAQRPRAQPRVGLPALAGYLQNKIAANAEKLSVKSMASDVLAVAACSSRSSRASARRSTTPTRPSDWSRTSPS